MRRPLVAGNWKMNKNVQEAALLVADLMPGLEAVKTVDCVLCPPFTSLMVVSGMVAGTEISLGAQNIHWEDAGAYTGEISPAMIREFCQYTIIGHSERRAYFHESDEMVNKKIKAALLNDLIPIVCVGETLEEREKNQTSDVITRQVTEAFKGFDSINPLQIIIAYEPVWAIGTGKASVPEDANDVIGGVVRASLIKMFGEDHAQQIRVLYGGSVNGQNAYDFFGKPEIDGGLVGGASLKPSDFLKIVEAAS